jgi:hypothetical protein
MKQDISLDLYLKFGGKLENIDWNDVYLDYYDSNQKSKIISYKNTGEKNIHNMPLFYFTFDNGKTHKYAIMWIRIKVEVVLSEKYTNINDLVHFL